MSIHNLLGYLKIASSGTLANAETTDDSFALKIKVLYTVETHPHLGAFEGNKLADVISGVVHLTEVESNELYDLINNFIKKRSKSSTVTHPIEYALIAYRADLKDNKMEELK